ncbi:Uncharacterised protein [Serratia liquefaciens]|nr:Uncharacterised protein [Serratia liquefaciens]
MAIFRILFMICLSTEIAMCKIRSYESTIIAFRKCADNRHPVKAVGQRAVISGANDGSPYIHSSSAMVLT